MSTAPEIEIRDGVLVGPIRHSLNEARHVKGSIHDDATVAKLDIGYRGGTVAGSVHFNLFPPLLVEAFGRAWFETGTLSMNFLNPTTDGEPVRAFVTQPAGPAADTQVSVWIERDDGMRVGEGTAGVGSPGEPTFLLQRGLTRFEPTGLKILDGLKVDATLDPVETSVPHDYVLGLLERNVITEPLDWYRDSSPWDAPIIPPAEAVAWLFRTAVTLPGRDAENVDGVVGLFGAIELRHVDGPLFADTTYRVGARVAALGDSPKTEFVWLEAFADDPSGRRAAEMLLQLRYVKKSSPLYQ